MPNHSAVPKPKPSKAIFATRGQAPNPATRQSYFAPWALHSPLLNLSSIQSSIPPPSSLLAPCSIVGRSTRRATPTQGPWGDAGARSASPASISNCSAAASSSFCSPVQFLREVLVVDLQFLRDQLADFRSRCPRSKPIS